MFLAMFITFVQSAMGVNDSHVQALNAALDLVTFH